MSWIAVAIVTMIGCGVYCGAFFYGDAMEESGETFFRESCFEDLDIVALQGISEEEIEGLLSIVGGIADAEGTYQLEGGKLMRGEAEADAVLLMDTERVGASVLVEGTMPEHSGECALTADTMRTYGLSLGEKIRVKAPSSAPEGLLRTDEYTVSAMVNNPQDYRERGIAYVILPKEAFDMDKASGYYSYVRVKAKLPESISSISEQYDDRIQEISVRLDDALRDLAKTAGEERKEEAEKKLEEKRLEVENELSAAKKTLDEKEEELKEGEKTLTEVEKEMEGGDSALADAEAQIEEGRAQIRSAEDQLASGKRQLSAAEAELKQKENELRAQEAALGMPIPAADAELSSARSTLAQKKAELKEKEALLEEKKAELAEAEKTLEEKKQQYEEAKESLPQKKEELQEGKKKLAEAKEEYEQKKEEAEQQLSDGERAVEELGEVSFAVTTRNENGGYVLHRQLVEVLRELSTIFVVIFMGIGVVVVFSTITILVDNQKKLIGAMKAFGFRNGEIISKYCVFGLSAICAGMGLSILLAAFLQFIIHQTVEGFFTVDTGAFNFRIPAFLVLFVLEAVIAVGAATLSTWHNAVRSNAVDLMSGEGGTKKHRRSVRVRANESLYSRLIYRNMKKDAARVLCSIIIIGGSCLMMGVGFTLDGAFEAMMPLSAEGVKHFQLEVSASVGYDDMLKEVAEKLKSEGVTFGEITGKNSIYRVGDIMEYGNIITLSPEDMATFYEFWDFEGKGTFSGDGSGVLIPSKVSERLGVHKGDEISLCDSNLNLHSFTVDGVYRSYIGRDLIVSQETFKDLFGESEDITMLAVRTEDKEGLKAELQSLYPGLVVNDTSKLPEDYIGMQELFRTLVMLMTSLSVIMSVFVLLNLVDIFVGRRKNELIIMGVNGFSVSERIGYLLRETVVTTVLGLILGMVVGAFLTRILIPMVEGTDTMYRRAFSLMAWMLACGLEAVFALFINLFAFRRIRNYEMTELTR